MSKKYYAKLIIGSTLVILFWLGVTTNIKILGENPTELVTYGFILFGVIGAAIMTSLLLPYLIYKYIRHKRNK